MGRVDIESLSPEERLQLIGELWDSLTGSSTSLSQVQEAELDRRLDALELEGAEPGGIPWEEVLQRIRQRGK